MIRHSLPNQREAILGDPGDTAAIVFGSSRHNRRLSESILSEFNQACANNKPEVALQLLDAFESIIRDRSRPDTVERRKLVDKLIAAHEQLWHIMHPGELLSGELAALTSTKRKTIH
jgi:hypothetical protein